MSYVLVSLFGNNLEMGQYLGSNTKLNLCYQFRVPRNLRIDIKDRLEEYSQSIEIDIHDCTQTQKSQL